MLNKPQPVAEERLQVFEGLSLPQSGINVGEAGVIANVSHAITLPIPQIRVQAVNRDVAIIVGGGPSLTDTFDELRDLYFAGAKVFSLNGAYHWLLERNIRPHCQIVVDAQPHNVRFVEPAAPQCRYLLASQCHPDVWAAVKDRPDVWMFHAGCADEPLKSILDAHYEGNWFNVGGGTTVATRALCVLRMLGFLRFELFGIDCCWMGAQHHAYAQSENANDQRIAVDFGLTRGRPRRFICSPWQLKQLEDFLRMIRVEGDLYLVNVHGDGMLAYALAESAKGEVAGQVVDTNAILQGA